MIETPHPSRRALFTGAGAVGAAALLGACSDDPSPPAAGASTPATEPTSGAASPAPSAADGGGEFVAKVSDVPVGGGKVVADKGVVVTQPVAGTFKGFSSTCTHMQCPVASVSNGTINCDCHFSKYSIKDGSVVSPPAPRALPPVAIKVKGGNIELA